MLKITQANESIEVTTAKVLLYGQPGVGKTSTIFTASDVLLLDTDNGAYRSAYRKDAVLVHSWDDIADIKADDITDYKTIGIDTVGRLLDYLAASIIAGNPKMGFNGALTLQGYGQLKSRFAEWIKRLNTMGKNVVMVAHDKEEHKGDNLIVRPDVQGGSYHEIFKLADAVGYMYHEGEHNILNFNPTSEWVGKNVAQLEPIKIPSFSKEPEFFQNILDQIIGSMNHMSAEGKAIADVVEQKRKEIAEITNAEGLNNVGATISELPPPAVKQVRHLLSERAKELPVEIDKENKCYVDKETEDVSG